MAKNRVVINNALGGDARAGGDGKLRCTEYSEMRYCGSIIFGSTGSSFFCYFVACAKIKIRRKAPWERNFFLYFGSVKVLTTFIVINVVSDWPLER